MSNRRLRPSFADAVTIANAICGFVAIIVVARAWADGPASGGLPDTETAIAAALIVAGAAFDSVDGIVARRFGGSPLGEHLEVMSDALTFGLAPAVLFAVDAGGYASPWDTVAVGIGAAYLVAALLRLARYVTLTADDAAGHALIGFPSPPAAMAMVAIVGLDLPAAVAGALVLLVAVLMTGTFSFPVMSGFVGRFIGTWFVLAFIAIFTLPAWVPASATLIMFAIAFVLIRQQRLT